MRGGTPFIKTSKGRAPGGKRWEKGEKGWKRVEKGGKGEEQEKIKKR